MAICSVCGKEFMMLSFGDIPDGKLCSECYTRKYESGEQDLYKFWFGNSPAESDDDRLIEGDDDGDYDLYRR